MKLAECELESVTAYSQSKHYGVPKLARELDKDYEERTWRERCHVNEKGNVMIPPMAFANNVKEAAKFLNLKIPGQRNATYTKHFEAGILVTDPLVLPIKKDEMRGEWCFVPSTGVRGAGSRVSKCFPLIPSWSGSVFYYIMDDIITEDVFKQVMDCAGSLIGIGRFRPRNMGYYGRFRVKNVTWADQ